MSLKITHKNSTAAGTPPVAGDIDVGEIAINAADAELYTKDINGNIRKFQNTTTGTADGVQFTQTGSGAVQRTVESKLQDVVSVKDFGAVGDGVTDDTSSVQSAVTVAVATNKVVYAPAGTYLLNGTINFNPSNASGVASFGVIGEGAAATIFKQSNHDADTFSCIHTDSTKQFVLKPLFRDFQILYSGAGSSNTGAAIRHRESNGGVFWNLQLRGCPYGIVSERGFHGFYNAVYCYGQDFAAGGYGQAGFVFTSNPAVAARRTSSGNYVNNCEIQAGEGWVNAIKATSVDGLYITNCHFDYAQTTLLFQPNVSVGNTDSTIRQVLINNCYFDNAGSATLDHLYAAFLGTTGTGGTPVDFLGITFNNCQFRGDGSVSGDTNAVGFRIAGYDFSATCSSIEDLSFTNNFFTSYVGGCVNLAVEPAISSLLKNIVIANNTVRSIYVPTSNAIVAGGSNGSITGNIFDAAYPALTSVIFVGSTVARYTVNGNIFSNQIASNTPINISTSATLCQASGNIDSDSTSSSNISDILEQGTNSKGYYIKYRDGRMHCRRTVTKASQDINVAWGSLFTSNDLLDNAAQEHEFPQTFIAVPQISVQVCAAAAGTLTETIGVPTTTNWPNDIRAVRGTTATNQTINVYLTADGFWR